MRLVLTGAGLALLLLPGCQADQEQGSATAGPAPTDQTSPTPGETLEILPGEREILRLSGTGKRTVPGQNLTMKFADRPAYVLYAACTGPSAVAVADSGPEKVRWSVPCDGVPSRREVYTAKAPLRVALAADGKTRWTFVITQPQ